MLAVSAGYFWVVVQLLRHGATLELVDFARGLTAEDYADLTDSEVAGCIRRNLYTARS